VRIDPGDAIDEPVGVGEVEAGIEASAMIWLPARTVVPETTP